MSDKLFYLSGSDDFEDSDASNGTSNSGMTGVPDMGAEWIPEFKMPNGVIAQIREGKGRQPNLR
jgi:hypothetical protein